MKNNKIFYGWIIVAASCLIMGTTMGIITNCNSLYIKPISEELKISRQTISVMISLQNLGTMATALFAGKIFNEKNTVKVMKLAVSVMVVVYFMNSLAQHIQMLYITYLINGAMLSLVTTLPIAFLINNWFKEKVGVALGLASMGSGFGGAIFNFIAGHLMESVGWRNTYRVLSLMILAVAVPCIFFVLKLTPSQVGLSPYGYKNEQEQIIEHKEEEKGYTFSEARKTKLFWILCAVSLLIGICMNSMYNTISPHLQDKGYSLVFSANIFSICLLFMAFGKIAVGRIFDSYGVKVAFSIACSALTTATIGMIFCRYKPALILLTIGVGFGCIFGAVVYPMSIPLLFGKKDYRSILGLYSSLISCGGIIGPVFAGKIYDLSGAYDLCYIIDVITLIIVVLVVLVIFPAKDKQFL